MNPAYQDGYFRPEQETTVIPQMEYPFSEYYSPDTYSKVHDREYLVQPRLARPRITNRTSWTNLLTYSEAFDNGAWTSANVTVTADATTSPDGNATMDQVLETAANAEHSLAQAATVAAAVTEAFVFAQGGLGRSFVRLAFTDSAATVFYAFFDVVGGAVKGTSAGVSAKVIAMGGSQYQLVMSFMPAAGAGTWKVNVSSDGSTISYAGDTAKGVYLWGAQIATGTDAPYVPTTTATRTISAPDRELAINPSAQAPDPLAYLCHETNPSNIVSKAAKIARQFARIPRQQNSPGSYIFTAPNIPPVSVGDMFAAVSSPPIVPTNAASRVGNYGFASIVEAPKWSGYFGPEMQATKVSSTYTLPAGHNCVVGDVVIYQDIGATYQGSAKVATVSGNDITLTGLDNYYNAVPGTYSLGAQIILSLISANLSFRRRTRSSCHQGEMLTLTSRVIEDYYLPGVTPGIALFTDIVQQPSFSVSALLAAYAAANNGSATVAISTKMVAFTGHNGVGDCTATGVLSGDVIMAVWNITDSSDATTSFDVTNLNKIHQISASNLSTKSFVAFLKTTGNGVWFNVAVDQVQQWKGPILVQRYTQCRLGDV